jgi:hypothetical protein
MDAAYARAFARADREIDKTAQAIVDRVNKLLAFPDWRVARANLVIGLLHALLRDHDVIATLDKVFVDGVESVLRVGRLSPEKRYGGKLRSLYRGWVCG